MTGTEITLAALGASVALVAFWWSGRNAPGAPSLPPSIDSVTTGQAATVNLPDALGKYGPIYRKWGAKYNVNPKLLRALALVESSERPDARSPANCHGLMQILWRDANGDGSPDNRFYIEGWPCPLTSLYEPDFNVSLGAQIIAWNIKTYGLARGVAVYNAWDSRHAPAAGPFHNQGYVDKVLAHFERMGGVSP